MKNTLSQCLVLMMALVLLIALCACGGQESKDENEVEEETAEEIIQDDTIENDALKEKRDEAVVYAEKCRGYLRAILKDSDDPIEILSTITDMLDGKSVDTHTLVKQIARQEEQIPLIQTIISNSLEYPDGCHDLAKSYKRILRQYERALETVVEVPTSAQEVSDSVSKFSIVMDSIKEFQKLYGVNESDPQSSWQPSDEELSTSAASLAETAYNDCIDLTIDDLEWMDGIYTYQGLLVADEDWDFAESFYNEEGLISQGGPARAISMNLMGIEESRSANNDVHIIEEKTFPLVFGKNSVSDEEIAEARTYFVYNQEGNAYPMKAMMKKLESLDSVNGTFDYNTGHFDVSIQNISDVCEELGITPTAFGYLLGRMQEYIVSPNEISFSGDGVSIIYDFPGNTPWE